MADKLTKRPFEPSVNISGVIPEQAFEKGLCVRAIPAAVAAGDSVQYCSPLIITKQEADKALDILYPILAKIS